MTKYFLFKYARTIISLNLNIQINKDKYFVIVIGCGNGGTQKINTAGVKRVNFFEKTNLN